MEKYVDVSFLATLHRSVLPEQELTKHLAESKTNCCSTWSSHQRLVGQPGLVLQLEESSLHLLFCPLRFLSHLFFSCQDLTLHLDGGREETRWKPHVCLRSARHVSSALLTTSLEMREHWPSCAPSPLWLEPSSVALRWSPPSSSSWTDRGYRCTTAGSKKKKTRTYFTPRSSNVVVVGHLHGQRDDRPACWRAVETSRTWTHLSSCPGVWWWTATRER